METWKTGAFSRWVVNNHSGATKSFCGNNHARNNNLISPITNSPIQYFPPFKIGFFSLIFFLQITISPALSFETVSLKKYKIQSLVVSNPIDLTALPPGKTYQVTDPSFVLQFALNGTDVHGLILKRNPRYSLFIRWCFFRSCEESQYDYNYLIADANFTPTDQSFFSARLPATFRYKFQGMKFSAVNRWSRKPLYI